MNLQVKPDKEVAKGPKDFEAGKTFALGATAVALRAMGPLPSTLTTLLVAAGRWATACRPEFE
ncbi:hypothetical protein AK812_SmicGene46300, partial [Symbiodinium microadriaticum]